MSGQPTRAGLTPPRPSTGRLPFLPGEWGRFGAFLRQPVLPDRAQLSLMGSVRTLAPLFALDLLLMALVFAGIGAATWAGFKLPQHVLNDLKLTPGLIAVIILAAPLAEEVIFRGWLSGRIGHMLGSALATPAILALVASFTLRTDHPEQFLPLLIFAAVLGAVALGLVFALRKRDAMPWFQRHFRWFYLASALLFAGMHLTNFAGTGLSASVLPLVLPQLMLGLILGYLRVNRGLLTGAALHMLHNALFASLMLAGVK